ncbi:MAG: hypothetical protein M1314_03055 [Firmicutes bacterium]|nr:hypothetical protein [Bacillota bacterium]
MTINIAIAVAEGLVMAADSVSQMQQGGQVLSTHSSVEKLTEIGGLPIAAMVHGIGSIEKRTILSLIREYEFDQRKNNSNFMESNVLDVTNSLADFIEQRYNAVNWGAPPQIQTPNGLIEVNPWPPQLGIVVGGYSPGEFFPDVFQIQFPRKVIERRHPVTGAAPGDSSISWWGVGGPLKRLLLGFDIDLLMAVDAQITKPIQQVQAGQSPQGGQKAAPQPAAAVAPVPSALQDALVPVAPHVVMPTNIDGMPLQDAVEFADYLGNVVIGYDRFTIGPPSVGGCLDVLSIQPEGLSWYRRKEFASLMAQARRT